MRKYFFDMHYFKWMRGGRGSKPEGGRRILVITEDGCIEEGEYDMFEWDEIICWMYKEDFPFPKKEDFK